MNCVLVAVGDKAKAAEHFDRSLDRKADVSAAVLTGGDLDLCTTKTIVGRRSVATPPARPRNSFSPSSSTSRLGCVDARASTTESPAHALRPPRPLVPSFFLAPSSASEVRVAGGNRPCRCRRRSERQARGDRVRRRRRRDPRRVRGDHAATSNRHGRVRERREDRARDRARPSWSPTPSSTLPFGLEYARTRARRARPTPAPRDGGTARRRTEDAGKQEEGFTVARRRTRSARTAARGRPRDERAKNDASPQSQKRGRRKPPSTTLRGINTRARTLSPRSRRSKKLETANAELGARRERRRAMITRPPPSPVRSEEREARLRPAPVAPRPPRSVFRMRAREGWGWAGWAATKARGGGAGDLIGHAGAAARVRRGGRERVRARALERAIGGQGGGGEAPGVARDGAAAHRKNRRRGYARRCAPRARDLRRARGTPSASSRRRARRREG